MKVLSIGSDRKLFESGASVRARILEYGSLFEELHIIVFARASLGLAPEKISANVWLTPTNSRTRLGYLFKAYKIGRRIIKKDAKESRQDWIVTAQDPFESGLAGLMLARLPGVRLVLQVHTDLFSPYFKRESFLNKIRLTLAKRILPRANRVRAVSERVKNSLLVFGLPAAAVRVLPIWIDVKKIQQAPVADGLHQKYQQFNLITLIASRLTREKNIALAIKAIAEPVKADHKVGLIIVGDGPEKENLRLLAYALRLQNNVIFEPWADDIIYYYKTADVFLNTSNYEGYGRSLVEAAAAGCPIITSAVGVVGELLKDEVNAFVCPVGDRECFGERLRALLADRSLREQFSREGQKAALAHVIPDKAVYLDYYKKLFIF